MGQPFQLHDRVTDGYITGEIVQIDAARDLYLVEYLLWPGEPTRLIWCSADRLTPKPLPVVADARVS